MADRPRVPVDPSDPSLPAQALFLEAVERRDAERWWDRGSVPYPGPHASDVYPHLLAHPDALAAIIEGLGRVAGLPIALDLLEERAPRPDHPLFPALLAALDRPLTDRPRKKTYGSDLGRLIAIAYALAPERVVAHGIHRDAVWFTEAAGRLTTEGGVAYFLERVNDPDPAVAAAALWRLTIVAEEEKTTALVPLQVFERLLHDRRRTVADAAKVGLERASRARRAVRRFGGARAKPRRGKKG